MRPAREKRTQRRHNGYDEVRHMSWPGFTLENDDADKYDNAHAIKTRRNYMRVTRTDEDVGWNGRRLLKLRGSWQ